MAVRVPTTFRVCLNCKINSDANARKEFHEIYDEVGLELQLPFLVKTFFYIDLKKEDKQRLCDDCVNRLIELYDLDEHAKEESCKTNNLKNNTESSNEETNENGNLRYELQTFRKPFVIDKNNTQINLPKRNSIEYTRERENAVEIHNQNKSEDKDCKEYSEDFNSSLSSSVIKDEKSYVLESIENMECISDDENQNVEINKQSNAKIIVGSIKLKTKEQEDSQDFNISSIAIKYEKLDVVESNEHMEFISDDENQNVEKACTTKKTYNENEGQKDLYVEEVDNRSNQVLNSGDSKSLQEELKTTKENEAFLLNASSSEKEFSSIKNTDADDFIEQAVISADTCSLEEENLFDETSILSEGYDQVDLNDYLDKVLMTKFQDMLLTCEMECKLCLEKYNTLGELLNHACMTESAKEQQFSCIIKDCEEYAKDLPTLARHLVLKHYDKLESTFIYGKCSDCRKTFPNVLEFNKHSCCRNIKRKIGTPKYCKYCDLNFQSFKRYVFHMQFHLKNHRPKICLLCGDLFNNSNDFFEHTQYKHIPKTALTCKRCDRFFKDIKVFNIHMEVHDDSKCLHECAHCPKKYTTKFALGRHMDIYHNNKSNALQCEYCSKKFGYKTAYRNHIKTHAEDAKVQTFICSTCGLITRNMEMIKVHIESDKESVCFSSPNEKKILGLAYSCENCSLDFCTIKHLKDHRLSASHSDDMFNCYICKKRFNTLIKMRCHFGKHKEFKEWQESFPITRNFVCNIGDCQEFYSIWSSLYYHKRRPHKAKRHNRHNKEKIKCSYCKSNLPSQKSLERHIDKYHTSIECDICLKKYNSKQYLEKHRYLIHNIKRFFCKHCQKGFFLRNLRNLHEKNVHTENTFKCKLCKFKTTYLKSFEIHMDKHKNGEH